ncbi:MAG: SDR family oxidoreductase [Gammaproteobacteria bacterium]|nr:SDR family oxidoreductase [Gammaproteobacteria bacterium]
MSRIPLGRLGEVEDLIGMAIYLFSPAADICTGQVMYVDGGLTAGLKRLLRVKCRGLLLALEEAARERAHHEGVALGDHRMRIH